MNFIEIQFSPPYYYNLRRNPLYIDEDENGQTAKSKDTECYKPSSYSSGYWSNRGMMYACNSVYHVVLLDCLMQTVESVQTFILVERSQSEEITMK